MTVDTHDLELKLIRRSIGVELDLEPLQGLWTEAQYLKLTDQSNHLIEFTDGYIEVLPMPTKYHRAISRFLFLALLSVIERMKGDVFYAYAEHGVFRRGDRADSPLLPGFAVLVDSVFDGQ